MQSLPPPSGRPSYYTGTSATRTSEFFKVFTHGSYVAGRAPVEMRPPVKQRTHNLSASFPRAWISPRPPSGAEIRLKFSRQGLQHINRCTADGRYHRRTNNWGNMMFGRRDRGVLGQWKAQRETTRWPPRPLTPCSPSDNTHPGISSQQAPKSTFTYGPYHAHSCNTLFLSKPHFVRNLPRHMVTGIG